MANESVVREEHNKYYIHFSRSNHSLGLENSNRFLFEKYIADFFYEFGARSNNLSVKQVKFQTDVMNTAAYLYPTIISGDKSVFVSIQAEDNYSLGMYVTDNDNLQDYCSYVDSYGECKRYRCSFLVDWDNDKINDINYVKKYPTVSLASREVFVDNNDRVWKDNAETLKITEQFDFVSDNDDIIIGDAMGTHNSLTLNSILDCRWLYSATKKLNKKMIDLDGYVEVPPNVMEVFPQDNNVSIGFIYPNTTGFDKRIMQSIALVNENNELVLGINSADVGGMFGNFYIYMKGDNEI